MSSRATHRRIRELLTLWEEFDQIKPNGSSHDFAHWLLAGSSNYQSVLNQDAESSQSEGKPQQTLRDEVEHEGQLITQVRLAIQLTKLSKVLRNQVKQVLSPLGFSAPDDYHYMASIYPSWTPTKSELIQAHLHEITTGTEIIKRLVKQGWVIETPHPTDKRSKRISLTEEGRLVTEKAFAQTTQVAIHFFGALDDQRLDDMYGMLTQVGRTA